MIEISQPKDPIFVCLSLSTNKDFRKVYFQLQLFGDFPPKDRIDAVASSSLEQMQGNQAGTGKKNQLTINCDKLSDNLSWNNNKLLKYLPHLFVHTDVY